MERMTIQVADGRYTLPDTEEAEAVQRLARYENLHESVLKEQAECAAKLEALRGDGKEKTVKFRELLARKLTGSQVLALLQAHGLE